MELLRWTSQNRGKNKIYRTLVPEVRPVHIMHIWIIYFFKKGQIYQIIWSAMNNSLPWHVIALYAVPLATGKATKRKNSLLLTHQFCRKRINFEVCLQEMWLHVCKNFSVHQNKKVFRLPHPTWLLHSTVVRKASLMRNLTPFITSGRHIQ